jgi:hypothetical protein
MATIEAHVDLLLRDAQSLASPERRAAWMLKFNAVIDQMIFYRAEMFQLDEMRRADKLSEEENRQELQALLRTEDAWLRAAAIVAETIELAGSYGFVARQAVAFREVCMRRHISGLDPREIEKATREFDAGGGRPLSEIKNELRRRAV